MAIHIDFVNKWIKEIEHHSEKCNGMLLAGYAFNAGASLRNAYHDNEIDRHKEKELTEKINNLIKSFNINCWCRSK